MMCTVHESTIRIQILLFSPVNCHSILPACKELYTLCFFGTNNDGSKLRNKCDEIATLK